MTGNRGHRFVFAIGLALPAMLLVCSADGQQGEPPQVLPLQSAEDYGFTDWKVSEADWQNVRDYYTSPARGEARMTDGEIDRWRPFANAGDRHALPRGEFEDRYFKPGFPDGLGNVRLAEFGLLDVTAAPFHATPDDGRDDTVALQTAINFARDHQLVAFLPAGDYHLRNTLFLSQGLIRQQAEGGSELLKKESYGVQLIGSTKDPARRARLVLIDGTFTDPDDTWPAVYVHRVWSPKPDSHPYGNSNTVNYANLFAGIDIDLGENPGAWGISFQAAEGSSLQDVTIDARGATGGVNGFPGSGGSAFDVTVLGGRVGVQAYPAVDEIDFPGATEAQPGPTLTHFTLIDQTEWAIAASVRGPLTVVGATIRTQKTGPVILVKDRWWKEPFANSLCLIDSVIEYSAEDPANTAVDTVRSCYFENVYVKNAVKLFDDRLDTVDQGWTHVVQAAIAMDPWQDQTRSFEIDFSGDGNKTRVVIDVDEQVYLDGKPAGDTLFVSRPGVAPPSDITAQHALGQWPTFETGNITNVQDYGAQGDGDTDDTASIQRAINAAGDGGVVFVPKGIYVTRDTLTLRAHQTLIGVHHKLSQLIGVDTESRGRFGGEHADPKVGYPMIRTVDAPRDRTRLGFLGIRPNRTYAQHSPEIIGVYGLEWMCGKGQVRGVEVKYATHTNFWEQLVLRHHYGLEDGFLRKNYARSEAGKLDPRHGWEVPDPDGFGGYGQGPGPGGSYPVSPLIHSLVQIRGNGGGQWFQFWNHGYDPVVSDHRTLLVDNTHNGLRIYHLHIQHKRSDAQSEIRNSSNVDIYGIKQEMHGRFLDIRASHHVRVHGMAGIGGPFEPGEAMFWIDGNSSDVLISNLGEEPQISGPSYGTLSPRSRLWRASIMQYVAIWDDTSGQRVATPPACRPILYMLGDPLGPEGRRR